MENNYQSSGELFEFGFDEQSKTTLKAIGKWTKLTAIFAFISYGISLISSFVLPASAKAATSGLMQAEYTGGIIGTIITVAFGVTINVFLWRFATEIVEGVSIASQPKIESAFGNLKTYFQIIGILVIIFLVIFFFFFLFALIMGSAGR